MRWIPRQNGFVSSKNVLKYVIQPCLVLGSREKVNTFVQTEIKASTDQLPPILEALISFSVSRYPRGILPGEYYRIMETLDMTNNFKVAMYSLDPEVSEWIFF